MVTYKKTFLFFMLFFAPGLLVGANFSVSLELSGIHYIKKNNAVIPTAFLHESFDLKVIIAGTQQAPNQVNIKGIEKFRIRGENSHSNVSITNSGMLVEQTTGYTLVAKGEGTFQIGPVTLTQNGQTVTSNTVTVAVEKKTEQLKAQLVAKSVPTTTSATEKQESPEKSEFYCTMRADKKNVFTEEPVLVTVAIHQCGNDNISIRGMQRPEFPNCTVREIEQVHEFKKQIDQKTYNVIEKHYIVFPSKPGALTITPAQIVYNVREQRKGRHSSFFSNDLFSTFFNHSLQQKVTPSNPVMIAVKKIPPHTEHTDGIGDFSLFDVSVDKTNVAVNEPIKLTFMLTGNANFDLIIPLTPTLPKYFKSYDSKTDYQQVIKNNMLEGTKTFEFIVQIPRAGNAKIPQQTFSYFDTKSQTIKTLLSPQIPLTVTMPDGVSNAPLIPLRNDDQINPTNTPVVGIDIHFIQEEGPLTHKHRTQLSILIFFLFLILIPSLVYFKRLTGLFAPLLVRIIPTNKKLAPRYQKQITHLVENNQMEQVYQLFISFLAEVSGLPAATITENWTKTYLEKNNFSSEKIDSFIQFLHECAQYSFTTQTIATTDLQRFEQQANYWLLFISQTIQDRG